MKYVGKKQVMSVKKFYNVAPVSRRRRAVKILAKSAAFATVSSSGATFFCNFSFLERKVSPEFSKT
jgi:hypothetical protein